jgi:hypothetical protein
VDTNKLTLPQLKEIATMEKVVLPEKPRILKANYIENIDDEEKNEDLPMNVDDREYQETEEAKGEDAANKEATDKEAVILNLLLWLTHARNCKKENIVIKSGRKT